MRLLLAQHVPYLPEPHAPTLDGPARATRALWEALATAGHECRAVAPAHDRGFGDAVEITHRGVRAVVVPGPDQLPRYAFRLAAEFQPHWTVVPAGDANPVLLSTALRSSPGRVVYLAHAPQQLPFGPRAFQPSAPVARLLTSVAGIIAVSRATQQYVHRWGGFETALIHPPAYGSGPFTPVEPGGMVAMLDPRGCRGLPILLALADARPDLQFLVGTSDPATAAPELTARPNIIIDRVPDIAGLLARARVLLMPSLWEEDFGYLAVDAMLRGVPVIASDIGGLAEAMLGVPYALPVNPIVGYEPRPDGVPAPEPVLPEQDTGPWLHTLGRLDDPAHHAKVSARAIAAATDFVANTTIAPLEGYLQSLSPLAAGEADLTADRRAALARIITWAKG